VADVVENHHGTAIALGAHAVLIRGPSGSGKSDLALRCIAMAPTALVPAPAMLVADDRVEITLSEERLIAAAPPIIGGKLEVRGLGIMTVPSTPNARLVLVADLVAPERVERLPDPPEAADVMGIRLPLLRVAPFEASAPAKLLLALAQTLKGP
jgi:HPr kinase/phosphorylase